MYRIEINIYKGNCASSWLFIRTLLQLILVSKRDSSGSGLARPLVKRLSKKRVEFLDYLSHSYLLKQNSAPWN